MCKDEESISFLNLMHAILPAIGALEWKQWNEVIAKVVFGLLPLQGLLLLL